MKLRMVGKRFRTPTSSRNLEFRLQQAPLRMGILASLFLLGVTAATQAQGVSGSVKITPSPGYAWSWTLNNIGNPSSFTVTNSGSSTLTLGTPFYTLTGTNAADFAVTGGTCTSGGTLSASSSCTAIISFTPTQYADETATLNISGATGTATLNGFVKAVDWTHVGIPGGIPDANWPICTTISPSGGADDSVTIQTAVNNCAAGSVVVLNAGTYTLHRSSTTCYGITGDGNQFGVDYSGLCLTGKSIVLRGQGPNNTVLNYGDGANIISMGETYLSSSDVTFINVTAGATKGSTSLTLTSTAGITANSYIAITEANPTDPWDGNPLVTATGYTGLCDYCENSMTSNLMQQLDEVTAVNGNVLTLNTPLYFDYATTPQVYILPMIEKVGLENLRVVGTASSGTGLVYKNVNVEACAHCWVHNVESDWVVDKSSIYLTQDYENEISNNYMYEGYNHDSGADYMMLLEFINSENLVQNNIMRRARHATPQSGGSGNVYVYNYELLDYMGEYTSSLPETEGHGAEPYMNLWEGNVTENFEWDFAHGSSNDNTMFRNYIDMTDTDPSTGTAMTGGLIALNVAYYSNYNNVLGNVLGPYPHTSGCGGLASTYETDSPTSEVNGVIWQLGYYDDGGTAGPNQSLANKVGLTMTRGGNWDCVSNSVVWSSNIPSGSAPASSYLPSRALPNSLVFSAAPSYFAATSAVWPPINTAASTMVNQIPAQICYNAGPVNSLGGGFNPTSCYSSSVPPPQPPTDLSAVAH